MYVPSVSNTNDIQSAMTEIDKLAAIEKYSAHLLEVKAERQVLYKMRNTRNWINYDILKIEKMYSNIR